MDARFSMYPVKGLYMNTYSDLSLENGMGFFYTSIWRKCIVYDLPWGWVSNAELYLGITIITENTVGISDDELAQRCYG